VGRLSPSVQVLVAHSPNTMRNSQLLPPQRYPPLCRHEYHQPHFNQNIVTVIYRAVARNLFQPRQMSSASAKLILGGCNGGKGNMASAGRRVYNGGLGAEPQRESRWQSSRWGSRGSERRPLTLKSFEHVGVRKRSQVCQLANSVV